MTDISTQIPESYRWLLGVGTLPKIVTAALQYYGVAEKAGAGNNPIIMEWARDLGLAYYEDKTPWCGLFMARAATDSGRTPPKDPLWALNWAKFGKEGGQPDLGDILVFTRNGGGHVGIYVGEDDQNYHVLGGNQGDRVCFLGYDRNRLYTVRQPVYRLKPASAKPYKLAPSGAVATADV